MDLGITGRRAAVAAGSAGLGYAAAAALVAAGARVALCGRDAERAQRAAASLGQDAIGLAADVSTPEGAGGFVADAIAALGGVDILVTNAGGPPPGTFTTVELDAYRPALDLSLLSVVAMCKAAVPAMRERGWGRVVAITSVTVRQPIEFLILSNTARTGATGFLKSLALEVAADGVTVNSVQPGYHATDRLAGLPREESARMIADIPVGRLGDPGDFGRVVAFLCSTSAGYITGAGLPVDGGTYRGLM